MTFEETLTYLYERLPMFQRQGKSAFKKDLTNTIKLCEALDNPHLQFRSVHVAGTNGKGSTSHALAAILQEAGYKTGLYTSPHLKSFAERIRINGKEMDEEAVIRFVESNRKVIEEIQPSFFEVTVAMAFDHFAKEKVDIAIVEVGLGGRLDSTNVIFPELSLITNISLDHTDLLGNDLTSIAREKAGIIKPDVPVVVSEWQSEVAPVFDEIAGKKNSRILFASKMYQIEPLVDGNYRILKDNEVLFDALDFEMKGTYQARNLPGVLAAIELLSDRGWSISKNNIETGLASTAKITGFKGRWQTLGTKPLVICDIAHNEAGMKEVVTRISQLAVEKLHMVIGMVSDKDIQSILRLLPKNATYYFCQAQIPRALDCESLKKHANTEGLNGECYASVNEAIRQAKSNAKANDFIYVGGSAFVVAEIEGL